MEKYLGQNKWIIPGPHQLQKFIGLSLCAKFNSIQKTPFPLSSCIEHVRQIYMPDDHTPKCLELIESYWRDTSEEKRDVPRARKTYDKEFLTLARSLNEYGCEFFDCTQSGLKNGKIPTDIRVGINSHGIYVFDKTDHTVLATFQIEYLAKWGHVAGEYVQERGAIMHRQRGNARAN